MGVETEDFVADFARSEREQMGRNMGDTVGAGGKGHREIEDVLMQAGAIG